MTTPTAEPLMVRCAYASAASQAFTPDELRALLHRCRENNARLQVTGMLLYQNKSFFQLLEGPATAIDALYEKIGRDRRHQRVIKLISEPIEHRDFAEWTMGLATPPVAKLRALDGLNDFFRDGQCFSDLGSGRARTLLGAFREGSYRQSIG